MTKTITPSQKYGNKKSHPWRACPAGEHLVSEHTYHVPPSKAHPEDLVATRHEHCAKNPSKKDILTFYEIQYIEKHYFNNLKNLPTSGVLDEFKNADKYDMSIAGWVQFWNDVFHPTIPLTPNYVKALMASESGFRENPEERRKIAIGLMQARFTTQRYLKGEKEELRDHLIPLSRKELLNPSASICASIRWLFRKKEIASTDLGREATWDEAIEAYKSVFKNPAITDKRKEEILEIYQGFYQRLEEKK